MLWAEFVVIFLAAPLTMAASVAYGWVSTNRIPSAFVLLFVIAVLLLMRTKGFRWRSLLEGPLIASVPLAIGFIVLTGAITAFLTLIEAPRAFFFLPDKMPGLWLMITVFYPIFSVIPQGLIYRVLFFERYGGLFPTRRIALAVSAMTFGLAHLFYLNWVAVVLTMAGGVVFSWTYAEQRSFGFSVLLHAIAGWLLFTIGLGGIYFYHGSIG
ncbi:type II CAAX prenyl endopeptidase Rce1 family protein [uncultured Cohaesibacter sp.]|uniref:CPBP family glutamic-type intramembrane protease n=1 Tax=uncultured Cohaesibacter sp. TaxID=1002546 RepID=UPI0037488B4F